MDKLVAGESPDDSERAELGYELDAWHLAVIATGGNAEKVIRRLAAALGREFLRVACGGEMWAWLG